VEVEKLTPEMVSGAKFSKDTPTGRMPLKVMTRAFVVAALNAALSVKFLVLASAVQNATKS
jgi:hypothetical protein